MNKPNCETPTTTTCPPSPLPKAAMPLGSLRITPDRDAITEDGPHGGEDDENGNYCIVSPSRMKELYESFTAAADALKEAE